MENIRKMTVKSCKFTRTFLTLLFESLLPSCLPLNEAPVRTRCFPTLISQGQNFSPWPSCLVWFGIWDNWSCGSLMLHLESKQWQLQANMQAVAPTAASRWPMFVPRSLNNSGPITLTVPAELPFLWPKSTDMKRKTPESHPKASPKYGLGQRSRLAATVWGLWGSFGLLGRRKRPDLWVKFSEFEWSQRA